MTTDIKKDILRVLKLHPKISIEDLYQELPMHRYDDIDIALDDLVWMDVIYIIDGQIELLY